MDILSVMDKKDLMIIDALKENSRSSVREISKKTGVRPSTVHQRLARLQESGLIEKFTIKLNNDKTGENFIVWMFVKTKPMVKLPNKVLHDNRVREVFGITGEYDLLMKLKFRDVSEFNDFIINFRKEQQVEETHTMVATAVIKEEI